MPGQGEQLDPLQAEVISAALKYGAFADWFEERPTRIAPKNHAKAMDAFNRVEADLRRSCRRLLRRYGTCDALVHAALQSSAA